VPRRAHDASGFAVRMALTLAVTTAAVGAAQYVLAGQALYGRVTAQDLAAHRADAQVLQSLYDPAAPDPLAEGRALLGHVAARPGVSGVVVLAPNGSVAAESAGRHEPDAAHSAEGGAPAAADMAMDADAAAAPAAAGDGMDMDMDADGAAHAPAAAGDGMDMDADGAGAAPTTTGDVPAEAEAVLAGGDGRALDAGESIVYAVPLTLDGERHALVVTRAAAPVRTQVAAVRRALLAALAVGAAVALPLFFLLGGRRLAAQHRRAVDGAASDGLTGLRNHRSFHERLARDLADARGTSLTLALVDLDGFKQVNDEEGHRRGDDVIAAVAHVLREHAGADAAYRVGGDEFALVLRMPLDDAVRLCDGVRSAVAAASLRVTTSIGLAAHGTQSANALIDAADAALYVAKRTGRNRVVVDGSATDLADAAAGRP
jgi:diguanylate cyclase (GGDEF)-like protein